MHNTRLFKNLLFICLTVLLLISFISCSDDESQPEIFGTWKDAWGSLTVSTRHVDFGSYGGEVVRINAGQSYLIFKYTNNPSWNGYLTNRYNKLSWKEFTPGSPATIKTSEGWLASQTNSLGNFIAWSTADEVEPLTNIFDMHTIKTNVQ